MYLPPVNAHRSSAPSSVAAASGEVGAPSSLPVRVAQVFYAPAELFDRLRARPVWIGALLGLVALNLTTVLLMPEELLRELILSQAPAGAEPEAGTMDGMVRFARIMSVVSSLIMPALGAAVIAGALLVVYNVVLGGEGRFQQLFSAAVHALYIASVGALLGLVLAVAKGDPQVSLSLHLLVPTLDPADYLYRFLRGLNLFSLWTAAVLGIAVSRIYPKRPAGAAAALVVGLYVVLAAALAFLPGPGAA